MKNSTKLWYFILVFFVSNFVIYTFKPGSESFIAVVSDLLPIIASFFAVVGVYLACGSFKLFDQTKIVWLILLSGLVLDFLAEVIYGYLEIGKHMDMNENFPSQADYFWSVAYPFFFIGLAMMIVGYKKSELPMGKSSFYTLLSISFVVISGFLIYFLFLPIINDNESDTGSKIVSIYYSLGDLLVVFLASILIYITSLFGKNSISKPWKYIAFGFSCITISDLIYSYLSYHEEYGSGSFTDYGWHLGYFLIALAGIYQKELMDSLNQKA